MTKQEAKNVINRAVIKSLVNYYAREAVLKFDPDQPRDANGRWVGSGSGTFDSSSVNVIFRPRDATLDKEQTDRVLSMAGANAFGLSEDDRVIITARNDDDDGSLHCKVQLNSEKKGDLSVIISEKDKSIELEDVFLKETGKGAGTQVLSDIVNNASRNGFETLSCYAIQGTNVNGYYSWARMGFDGDLPDAVRDKAVNAGFSASKVSDLMKTKEGRAFWKENGVSLSMTFDLTPRSQSMIALENYKGEKLK